MVDIDNLVKYSHRLKLLYVEDNAEARELTTLILNDFFDDITVAVDGIDGFYKFTQNNFDLIITDINMPKLNGLDMVSKIRDIDKNIPILVLSAYNDTNFLMSSIKLGIDGYILKPIDIDQFITALQKIVDKFKYLENYHNNLNLLEQYQYATNESSIVSKTNTRGIITYVNDRFCELANYKREELVGRNHNIIRHPDNPKSIFKDMWKTIKDDKKIWRGVVRNRSRNGKSYYVDSIVMPILDTKGDILEYISLRNDITNIMNPIKQMTDALKNAKNPVLIYLKLDKYEEIEEFYDSDTMNIINQKVHQYLYNKFSNMYEFDILYNLDNGEYALIIDKDKYLVDKDKFIEDLKQCQLDIKNSRIQLEYMDYDISVLISVGYDDINILKSVKLGLKKMLKTKEDFILSNNLAQQEENRAKNNMKTIMMIKSAINQSKIISYFQPIIDNKTKEVVKYESLVRLIDQNNKVLTPYFFLDIAKKSDQYLQITNIVLEHSFSMLRNSKYDISINLSAIDIEEKHTRKKVLELLEIHKDDASRIVFELLEDESIKDMSTVKEFISKVKQYGVKIAIDDFGAGYSNYERLLQYQPDILKIDGCLIRDIVTNSYSLSVVKSIVTFAKEQKLQTIAEFIENEEIFNIIKDLGVDFSQGYYFGKPMDLMGNKDD